MKKILCFGDSNTFGFIPGSGKRYDENTRWSGILRNLLKGTYKVIEAGCNNRNAFTEKEGNIEQTGYKIILEYLKENPDIIILAAWINDLQKIYNNDEISIKKGITRLINIVKNKIPNATLILVSPSKLNNNVLNGYFGTLFDQTSIEKSYKIGEIYQKAAKENKCLFLNLDETAEVSNIDGLHYDKQNHSKIAKVLYNMIIELPWLKILVVF